MAETKVESEDKPHVNGAAGKVKAITNGDVKPELTPDEKKPDVKSDLKPEVKRDLDDSDDESPAARKKVKQDIKTSRHCPYLDTIDRGVLDFDFEKLCSVSLSRINCYACLVCGKYFQGRGLDTQANTHSLMCDHHVFLNLETLKFYCLPDNYEIIDTSLEDITYYLQPSFSKEIVASIDKGTSISRALDGTAYIPGVVGVNNIKANDYVNVVLQILCRVTPFRNFFLDERNVSGVKDPLVLSFGELIRKLCSPRNFKNHVSPHEFLQAVTNASKRRFKIIEQSDPLDLLSWLLDTLHRKLKKKKRVVHDTFKGTVKISKRKLPPTDQKDLVADDDPEYQEQESESQFLILPLDVPPPPLFGDGLDHNIIPQVPLFELLNKFDGVNEKEYKTHKDLFVKKFRLKSLPDYLIVHVSRFTKNNFYTEKNPTIVNFPIKNLILRDYLELADDDPSLFRYDLVANVVHEGKPGAGEGNYFAQVYHKGVNKWFQTQDLHVDEILPETITLATSYIQVWERQPEPEVTDAPAPETAPAAADAPMDATPAPVAAAE